MKEWRFIDIPTGRILGPKEVQRMAAIHKFEIDRYLTKPEGLPLAMLVTMNIQQMQIDSQVVREGRIMATEKFKGEYNSIFSFEKHIALDHYKYQGKWQDLPIQDLLKTLLGIKNELDAVTDAGETTGIEFLATTRQEEVAFKDFLPTYRLWVKLNSCFSIPGNGEKMTRALSVIYKPLIPQPLYPSWVKKCDGWEFNFTSCKV